MKTKIISLVLLLVITGCGGGSTSTSSVMSETVSTNKTFELTWDPNTDSNFKGYKLHYGKESGVYTDSVDVGSINKATISLPNGKYYFAVTAYGNEIESGYSNEVEK